MPTPLWQKGQPSANPGGRPKGPVADIAALAREYGPHAIATLVKCLSDPKHRVAAATALLDRGYGRPRPNGGGRPNGAGVHLIAAKLVSEPLEPTPATNAIASTAREIAWSGSDKPSE